MSLKAIVVFITAFLLLVIALSFLTTKTAKPEVKFLTYTTTDIDRPKIDIPITKGDLGTMKVSEEKQNEFSLINKGTKPLQIGYITSSCSCTVGQVIYNGVTSREYGMHDPGQDVIEVAPNTGAVVKVIYRPSVMPVYGPVEREVYVKTNDPEFPRLVLQVTANVQ